MSNNFNLNEDCVITGTIVFSEVTKASLATDDVGRRPVYSVEIAIDPDLALHVALLYGQQTGMHCINAEELQAQYINAKTLTFESLNKPLTSGTSPDTGEFIKGQKVRVSCRLEYKENESTKENGYFATPRLILRFVDDDADAVVTINEVTTFDVDDISQVYYDF